MTEYFIRKHFAIIHSFNISLPLNLQIRCSDMQHA